MKAQLVFNLDNPDDAMAHLRCVKALELALCLFNIKQEISRLSDISDDGKHIDYADVMDAINEEMERQSIKLDDLII